MLVCGQESRLPPGRDDGSIKTSPRVLFAAYILGLVCFCAIFYKTLFAWPAGFVTGNLLASAIWAPLAVIHLDQLSRRNHREHMDLLRRHHREELDAIKASGRPPVRGR